MMPYVPVADAYDKAAPWYDSWAWQKFWDCNECSVVNALLSEFSGVRRAVDFGTGTGRYLTMMLERGFDAYGSDISKGMLSVASNKLGNDGRLVLADARNLTFESARFDLAVAARMLCHIDDASRSFREFYRTVVSGGRLIVTELDPEHAFDQTRIPTPHGKVEVQTWKRSLHELTHTAICAGWSLDQVTRIGARQCAWLPAPNELSSIDRSGASTIFNVLVFRRS
jgi:ubiquinone/menaquinone biosynthesis C-methylase UbiE